MSKNNSLSKINDTKKENIKETKDISKNKVIIIIDNYKFDVTNYLYKHPGGKKILQKFNNKDATQAFNEIKGHCDGYVLSLLDEFCIGKCSDL